MRPHRYTLTVGGFIKLVYLIGLVAAVKVFARHLLRHIKGERS